MANAYFNFDPFNKLTAAVKKAGDASAAEPMGAMFTQWGSRYQTFTRRRYQRLSKGGGEWPRLKTATAKRRKSARRSRKGQKRKHSILINTRTMLNALSVGMTGSLNQRIRTPAGVRVGFSDAPHNNDSLTIRELAVIHDSGLGNVPQRTILVEPDSSTIKGMMSDAERATDAIMKAVAI